MEIKRADNGYIVTERGTWGPDLTAVFKTFEELVAHLASRFDYTRFNEEVVITKERR